MQEPYQSSEQLIYIYLHFALGGNIADRATKGRNARSHTQVDARNTEITHSNRTQTQTTRRTHSNRTHTTPRSSHAPHSFKPNSTQLIASLRTRGIFECSSAASRCPGCRRMSFWSSVRRPWIQAYPGMPSSKALEWMASCMGHE